MRGTGPLTRRQFIGTAATVLAASRSAGALSRAAADDLVELDQLIIKLMAAAGVPGAQIVVVKNAKPIWRGDYGVADRESKRPVDARTLFEAASVSKTVFAYAALQAVDRGVLPLDKPLSSFTEMRVIDDDARLDRITMRHVLSHTSGLPNFRSTAEPLAIGFPPGEKYRYSGEGYWYLQAVMSEARGRIDPRSCGTYEDGLRVCATDFDNQMRTNVLAPFGMGASGYLWNRTLAQHAARPHAEDGTPMKKGQPSAIDAARYGAAGGLHTTADEYARFLIAVIAPRRGRAFLADRTRAEMLRPHVKVDATSSWGLGWQIRHTPAGDLIQHQGGQAGIQAFTAASVARKSGYVILTNSANGWKVFYDERFTALISALLFS